MPTIGTLIASAALLSTLATVGFTSSRVDAGTTPAITLTPTPYGCDITVRAHNNYSSSVTIDLEDSEVKVKNGFWSKLNQGGNWVVNSGGNHESKTVSLDLGCSFQRQYKFLMRQGGDSKYIYFPDANSFTTSVSLGLANIGRHFD
jgi:hypothetical protein